MSDFVFNEYTFRFMGKDYFIKDIIRESDIWTINGMDKGIIKRPGISRLGTFFQFIEKDFTTSVVEFGTTREPLMIAKVTFRDNVNQLDFCGDGEASVLNLDSAIGKKYPAAMALKRARARAIINYLGLDFYSEDEATEFRAPENISLNQDQVTELVRLHSKKMIVTMIYEDAKKAGMSKEEIQKFARWVCGKPADVPLQLSDLTTADVWNIATALQIRKNFTNPDILKEFIDLISAK